MFKASLTLPATLSDIETAILAESLRDSAMSSSALRTENHSQSPWGLEWLFEVAPDDAVMQARLRIVAELHGIALPKDLEIDCEDVPDRDWLAHSYKQFQPFSVGAFFIYGSHYDGDIPTGQMGLQIDAATAFGSGEHGTTAGCLEAMQELEAQGACPWNVLDMGTGSGILGIAAWALWKTPVLAIDNDPESIIVTKRHMEANSVPSGSGNMRAFVNDGFAGDVVTSRGPFDLIIANILAGPLMEMARDLVTCADENGYVVLSGILNEQADSVRGLYQDCGLTLRKTYEIGEWSTLLLQKTAA